MLARDFESRERLFPEVTVFLPSGERRASDGTRDEADGDGLRRGGGHGFGEGGSEGCAGNGFIEVEGFCCGRPLVFLIEFQDAWMGFLIWRNGAAAGHVGLADEEVEMEVLLSGWDRGLRGGA